MNWAKVRWRMVNWLQWKKDEQNLVETRLSWVDEQKSRASKNILNSKFQFYLASFQSSYAFEFLREIRSIGVLHQRMQVMMFWCFKWPPSIDSQTLAFGCSCHCCYWATYDHISNGYRNFVSFEFECVVFKCSPSTKSSSRVVESFELHILFASIIYWIVSSMSTNERIRFELCSWAALRRTLSSHFIRMWAQSSKDHVNYMQRERFSR